MQRRATVVPQKSAASICMFLHRRSYIAAKKMLNKACPIDLTDDITSIQRDK
jgi:hypothetical protein